MRRGPTGQYQVVSIDGESARAFVPAPLPPEPPLALAGELTLALEEAGATLGRLDRASSQLPDRTLLPYAFLRKEVVLSTQIAGAQSSLTDLLLYELGEEPSVGRDDTARVASCVAALEHGLARIRAGAPLSTPLIRELRGMLLAERPGIEREPGELRRAQCWIGSAWLHKAAFVPPPSGAVPGCLAALEGFLSAEQAARDGLPALVRAALAHVQLESIHPFPDGNGRVARILIALLLCRAQLLHEPLLYLSLYFAEHRDEYAALVDAVRHDGEWEEWLAFFLRAVRETAESGIATVPRLLELFTEHDASVAAAGRGAAEAARVHGALKARPLVTLAALRSATHLSPAVVASGLEVLIGLGIARELSGRRRHRLFVYDRCLGVLREGTDAFGVKSGARTADLVGLRDRGCCGDAG